MKKIKITQEISVDSDFVGMREHELWEGVVNSARQLFYDKNHDYCSAWRIEDSNSIAKRILEKCVRILSIDKLKQSGKMPKVHEGIKSEFRDIINWAVFGVLQEEGYGWTIEDLLLSVQSAEGEPRVVQPQAIQELPPPCEEPETIYSDDISGETMSQLISLSKNIAQEKQASLHGAPLEAIMPSMKTRPKNPEILQVAEDDVVSLENKTYLSPEYQIQNSKIALQANEALAELSKQDIDLTETPVLLFAQDNPLTFAGRFILRGYEFTRGDILSKQHSEEIDLSKIDGIPFIRTRKVH